MALSAEQSQAIESLRAFLQQVDVDIIQELPPKMLEPPLRSQLQLLSEHFITRRPSPEAADDQQRPRKRAKTNQRRHDMARLAELSELSALSAPLQRYIDHHGDDPLPFLKDEKLLDCFLISEDLADDEPLANIFHGCYQYALQIQHRTAFDGVRWCFTMMLFHDLMEMLNPGMVVSRIGANMHHHALEFLQVAFEGREDKVARAQQDLALWCTRGKKLKDLCQEFGEGAVFMLVHLLSEDFIDNKFHMSGESHDLAYENLHRLSLRETAEQNQSTRLGQRVREVMLAPLRAGWSNR